MTTHIQADHAEHAPAAAGQETAVAATHEGTEHAGAHESGGMPQFDFAWWPGQILWFLIIFFVVMAFIRLFAAPKLGGTIEHREGHIAGQISDARRMKDEADAKVQSAAADMAQARAAAQKLASDARAKANAEAAARLAEEEAKLAETMGKAEAKISAARDKAMTNVAAIASETASAIVDRLTGQAVTAAELSGAKG